MKYLIILMLITLSACSYLPWAEVDEGPEFEALEKELDETKILNAQEIEAEREKITDVCGNNLCELEENRCNCPEDCGSCENRSSQDIKYSCVDGKCKSKILIKENPCGNGICEAGELTTCAKDCPNCNDDNACTDDLYDVAKKECVHEKIEPCCGNSKCEHGEKYNCLLDCGSNIRLSDYPEPFVINNTFQTQIIVGNDSANLIVAGIDVVRGLVYRDVAEGYTTKAKLDYEISSIKDKNVILLGNPCQNTHVKELMPYNYECLEDMKKNKGLLRLFRTGSDTYALLVAGYGPQDVRRAAERIRDWNETTFNGTEAWI